MGGDDSTLATNSASAGKGESAVVISGSTSTAKQNSWPKLELLIGSYQKGYHKKLDKD